MYKYVSIMSPDQVFSTPGQNFESVKENFKELRTRRQLAWMKY